MGEGPRCLSLPLKTVMQVLLAQETHIIGRCRCCRSGEERQAEIIVSPVRLSWPGELKTLIITQAFKNIVYSKGIITKVQLFRQ